MRLPGRSPFPVARIAVTAAVAGVMVVGLGCGSHVVTRQEAAGCEQALRTWASADRVVQAMEGAHIGDDILTGTTYEVPQDATDAVDRAEGHVLDACDADTFAVAAAAVGSSPVRGETMAGLCDRRDPYRETRLCADVAQAK